MKLVSENKPSELTISQWQRINKRNALTRDSNVGICLNCEADFETCSNDKEDNECSYFKELIIKPRSERSITNE